MIGEVRTLLQQERAQEALTKFWKVQSYPVVGQVTNLPKVELEKGLAGYQPPKVELEKGLAG